mmetsp:Transcript_7462/g.10261  ORF Transcript_7462/g.10261 Transcript_7462/m.10261 type:complete len:106 (+) Transcript_7462:85-402(+)|eukprot:CAMPEP_0185252036 /NCGR_PEP_ID=MMETSP1359-20130426/1276_1 /TAXON_ID=552665 /ORGANISM="Bigelowiella longifila, Strain CCMP242" /LENGTH=105 /DNA_ID=CAMNT_0027834119 /DNA_START=85 /DNA_END=402 /DNA_ORIENTATION=+
MPAFRVPGERLSNYTGQTVRIIGRVVGNDNGSPKLQLSSSGVTVSVTGSVDAKKYQSTYVEVIGRVRDATTVEELKSIQVDDSFDLETYNQMLRYSSGKYAALFS